VNEGRRQSRVRFAQATEAGQVEMEHRFAAARPGLERAVAAKEESDARLIAKVQGSPIEQSKARNNNRAQPVRSWNSPTGRVPNPHVAKQDFSKARILSLHKIRSRSIRSRQRRSLLRVMNATKTMS
jgi:hypothetical protein